MKNIYLLLGFLGSFGLSFGQTNNYPTTGSATIYGNVNLVNRGNGFYIDHTALSETLSGASTILGNNIKTGTTNNTVKRFLSATDPGAFVGLNWSTGITFHTGINSALNTEISAWDNEVMRLTHAGNVGIGTSSPTEKLSVNGKIRAHEIKVELNNWPDFVFAKGYQLPTFQETEKHIKEKGHLPGIPSAAEVEKNGIELGDMNKKLLQKIEELTLYLIEKDKKEEVQQQEIDIIKGQLNKILAKQK